MLEDMFASDATVVSALVRYREKIWPTVVRPNVRIWV